MQPRTCSITGRWICASLFAVATAGACTTAPTRAYRAPDSTATLPERPAVSTPPKPEPAPVVAVIPDECPIKVSGTVISVEDTSQGATLVLTTTGDADELRTALYTMADTNNQMHARMGPLPADGGVAVVGGADNTIAGENQPPRPTPGEAVAPTPPAPPVTEGTVKDEETLPTPSEGIYASGGVKPAQSDVGPLTTHSRARVESIAGGARIVFIAFPDDVAVLQRELHARARAISRDCAWAPQIEGDLR